MAIHFNHTILSTHDSKASATFLAEMLGLPAPRRWGPFYMVTTENGANLDYMDTEGDITPQHYAFLTSESEFDENLRQDPGTGASLLGRPRTNSIGQDQPSRRRARLLL